MAGKQVAETQDPVGVSLLAIGCEAVVKKASSPSQESRSDFDREQAHSYGKNQA
jgi:hypothetical protein